MTTIEIVDARERGRFELTVDGELASVADYHDEGGARVFPHTETLPALEGNGYGTRLVTEALERTAAAGLRIVPACPFVRHVLQQRPDLQRGD